MSGHSKWSTIKHKKARTDSRRSKAFSRLSKEIILAAKLGGKDIDANPRLRTAVSAAKAVNVPNDNIDRAIKKGCGELDGVSMDELVYEAYGPGGVAIIVDCLTDNRNRTAADIRHILTKANGNLATAGSVTFMFQRKSRFVIEGDKADEDVLMELFFDADVDVEDIGVDDGIAEVIAPLEAFDSIVKVLEQAEIAISESGVVRIPDSQTPVADAKVAQQVVNLIDKLEDYDDVQNVFANADIPDEILEQLSDG